MYELNINQMTLSPNL